MPVNTMTSKVTTFTLLIFTLLLSSGMMMEANAKTTKAKAKANKSKAKTTGVQMPAKWYKLNALIDKEEKAIKTITKMGPRLRWRLLELDTERIKLIREKENQIFLEANAKFRKKKGKDYFFKESMRKYWRARKEGLAILKKWPRFRYASDVYYTLALNARDYGGDKETEKFLLLALKNAIKHSPTVHAIKTSLAEHYYNKKKYKKAIRYYRDVLTKTNDEWYTKHLYNVSWCYIKTQQYNEAIDHALKSFRVSTDKESKTNYISVEDQVLESIGLFYVLGERIEEGTKFYVDEVNHPAPYLIKMAKKAATDKGADKAEYIYLAALDNALDKKSGDTKYLEEEINIRIELLDFYRSVKKFESFWSQSVALDEINNETPLVKINEEYHTAIVEKIRSFVGYLQVRFTRNSKTNIENFSPAARDRIIDYFDILARVNPKETDSYRFYQGETFFAINDFTHSFESYQRALEANKVKYTVKKKEGDKIVLVKEKLSSDDQKKHEVLTKKIFDALLASLEYGKFKKDMSFERTVYTYTNHLDVYPENERTRLIYGKLFNLYLSHSKVDESTSLLERYMKVFPKDREIQQGMLTQVMDLHIKEKNTDALAIWVNRLQKGFLSFKKDYIERSILILGGLLFDGYQKMDANGQKDEAAKGYIGLYQSEKYPQSIKAKAAYRASLLYLDLYETKRSYEWMNVALKLFTIKERFERKEEILAVVQNLMLAQDFNSSSEIAETYLDIYCTSRFKEKDDLYQASVQYRLIEGEYEKAYQNYERGKKCRIKKPMRESVLLGIGDFFFRHRKYRTFMAFHKRYQKEAHLKNFFHNSFMAMYWDYFLKDSDKGMAYIENFFKKQFTKKNKSKGQREMEMVMAFKKLATELEKTNVSYLPDPKAYKEESFNIALEFNIKTLKKMSERLAPYIKTGQAHVITKSYNILENKYKELASKLESYTPVGLPADYVQGLKGAMAQIAGGLYQEAKNQKKTAVSIINKETILGPNNKLFVEIPAVVEDVHHRHPASMYVLPSDRQGGPL